MMILMMILLEEILGCVCFESFSTALTGIQTSLRPLSLDDSVVVRRFRRAAQILLTKTSNAAVTITAFSKKTKSGDEKATKRRAKLSHNIALRVGKALMMPAFMRNHVNMTNDCVLLPMMVYIYIRTICIILNVWRTQSEASTPNGYSVPLIDNYRNSGQ